MMASRVSGSATVVVDAKMRMCVVNASSSPPPNAGAASADIVGMGNWDIEVKVPRSEVRKFVVLSTPSVCCIQLLHQGNYSLLGCECGSLLQVRARAETGVDVTG